MEDIIGTSLSAVALTFATVAAYKYFATSAPSWSVLVVALLAGQLFAFLTLLSEGGVLTTQAGSKTVLAGFAATLGAIGARGLDNKADAARAEQEHQ